MSSKGKTPIASAAPDAPLRAVIDIGSNSLRLVVYAGPARAPRAVVDEKVTAGLGRALADDGTIPDKAMTLALAALARFACLIEAMGVADVQVVATAAARDATNGAAFLDRVRALRLQPRLLSGAEEAACSALGVLSGLPQADGIVADLGGGSVELVDVANGAVGRGDSFALGTLRLPALRTRGEGKFARNVAQALDGAGWRGAAAGRDLYCVGGSWRALAHVDMAEAGTPLHDPHGHVIAPDRLGALAASIAAQTPRQLRDLPGVSANRAASLADATALLRVLTDRLQPARLVVSAHGLREGLLFANLSAAERSVDPLLVAARDLAVRSGGDVALGEALADWCDAAFGDDPSAAQRLRRVAAILSTIAAGTDRVARARRGVELALYEHWASAMPADRAVLAQALHSAAGMKPPAPDVDRLAGADALAAAIRWGAALRLGRRLSGGVMAVIERSRLLVDGDRLVLVIPPALGALYDDGCATLHGNVAQLLGLKAAIST